MLLYDYDAYKKAMPGQGGDMLSMVKHDKPNKASYIYSFTTAWHQISTNMAARGLSWLSHLSNSCCNVFATKMISLFLYFNERKNVSMYKIDVVWLLSYILPRAREVGSPAKTTSTDTGIPGGP